MSSEIVCVREFPGATTAILVGAAVRAEALPGFRAVLQCGCAPEEGGGGAAGQDWEIAPSGTGFAAVLERFLRRDLRHMPALYLSGVGEGEAQVYQSMLPVIIAALEQQHRARVTRERDAFLWQCHVLANLREFAHRPLPIEWRGKLAGCPAAVCGAGPSLDISAPHLAAAQGACMVFAADSAWRTLDRHGVRADFGISVDVAKVPEKCLPESGARLARVILSPVSPPSWKQRLDPACVHFVSSRQITIDWLGKQGVPGPALPVAENCGVTALELALWLGCGPIYLLGLDLALSDGQRHTHGADAAIYANSGFDPSQRFPTVPGNWSPQVSTHAIGDWRALCARLAKYPENLIQNINDRGAKLTNAIPVRPDAWRKPTAVLNKADLLSPIVSSKGASPSAWPLVAEALREAGGRLETVLPTLRAVLERQGPAALVVALRPILAEEGVGRALGSYALRLMPHLLPPVEGDLAFWRGALDEVEQLASLMKQRT